MCVSPAKETVSKEPGTWMGTKERQEDPKSNLWLLKADGDPGPSFVL